MTTIQVLKAFNLNIAEVITHFGVGKHEVSDEVATHPWVQHFIEAEAAPADNEKTAEQVAEETAAIVKGLVTDEKPVPIMDAINAALKEAGLPAIKAADRDAILTVTE
jgi:hypothetical protein